MIHNWIEVHIVKSRSKFVSNLSLKGVGRLDGS